MESLSPVSTSLPSLLDTSSTTIQSSYLGYRETLLLTRSSEMLTLETLLESLGESSALERLQGCRTRASFVWEKSTRLVKVHSRSCHVRFCPLCSASRSSMIRTNTANWLKSLSEPKFLTLTLKHTDDSLTSQVDRLYDSFRTMRRQKFFKKIRGGIWFFELKVGKDDKWHPHLHLVLDSPFLPQKTISEAWLGITGDSYVVDIKQIRDVKKVADYVAKYAVKPVNLISLSPINREIVYRALSGRRIVGTWGTAKKEKLTVSPKYNRDDWIPLGTYVSISCSLSTSEDARIIWNAFLKGEPLDDPPLYFSSGEWYSSDYVWSGDMPPPAVDAWLF